MEIENIKFDKIEVDKNQPRKKFEDIKELSSNIIKEGLLEPLKVMKEKDKYILVDGERRFRALQLINKLPDSEYHIVPCIVLKDLKNLTITQLSTDIHKNKLDPFEEAEAFKSLLESGLEVNDLKARLGKHRSYIIKRLKLLSFSTRTQEKIREGKIPLSAIDHLDIDVLKEKEDIIVSRIEEEAKNSSDVKKIIDEETHKYEYRINSFLDDLEYFKKELDRFQYYIKRDLDDAQITQLKLKDKQVSDVIKENNRFLYNLQKFDKIKEEGKEIKKKLEKLYHKFGGRHIIE